MYRDVREILWLFEAVINLQPVQLVGWLRH